MRQIRIRWLLRAGVCLLAWGLLSVTSSAADKSIERRIDFSGSDSQVIELHAGETVELSAGVTSPSKLPDNGRIAVEWTAPSADASFRKVLHALDPDVFVVYRAPQTGRYTL